MAGSASSSSRPDPVRDGIARGWKVLGGPHGALPTALACDVAIIGSGAGAGVSAELLSAAGLAVVIIEEGPLRTSSDFRQRESDAYPALYQDSANRKTADKGIGILQGRCVGGSTTVNWTTSFRTPPTTLAWWRDRHGLKDLDEAAMAPWFEAVERRLAIAPWALPPNANNAKLGLGAGRLKIPHGVIRRNVHGCWNLGSCGMGCPTNAKQSMLVTTIPAALARGATLWVQTRAQRLELTGSRVDAVICQPVTLQGEAVGAPTRLAARHVVVAGGAINTPALLLRSGAPDPHKLVGRRTFLHPVTISTAVFDEPIEGWHGAPQSVYSDHFQEQGPLDGPIGYKLEVPPLHPVIGALTLPGFGAPLVAALKDFAHTQALLALLRDGFHAQSTGGTVRLRDDGSPLLDYPLTPYVIDGARRALATMAEIQFAAGARQVRAAHEDAAAGWTSWAQARAAIERLSGDPQRLLLKSAHVMGGCAMAATPEAGVVRTDGRHWQLDNLSIHDGSVFPTSIGANPQLSVYGFASRFASALAFDLSGTRVGF